MAFITLFRGMYYVDAKKEPPILGALKMPYQLAEK